ncbi:MAG: carbohydrate binding domain-containing protein [Chloroflexota bacterium]
MRIFQAGHQLIGGWWRIVSLMFSVLIAGAGLLGGGSFATGQAFAAAAWDGVPTIPVDYDHDVELWWNTHPFNPASPSYAPEISSPAYQVNVRTQFNGSIQSAINSLPASGGTLYFPAGTYTGGFNLTGKKHVHFIGENGTVITSGMQNYILGCSMASDYPTFSSKVQQRDPSAIACATTGRIQDVYIKNITFDGAGSALVGIYMAAARDIVLDHVTFQNYRDPGNFHRGIVTGNALLDNIWVRDSLFVGRERYALYLDGVHGGGVINSVVENNFGAGAFLFLTNDDFSRDIDGNGRIDLPEQRTSQHVVVYGNQIKNSTYDLISAAGRQILIKDNVTTGSVASVANFQSKSSHIDANLTYEYKGNRVVGNRVQQARQLAEIQGAPTCPMSTNCARFGEYQVRDNVVVSASTFQQPAKEINTAYSTIETPNVVSNNCVASNSCSNAGAPSTPTSTPVATTPPATATPAPATPTTPPATATPVPATPAPSQPTPNVPAPATGDNLLQNGNLDAVSSGYPTGWRNRSTAAWDSAVKHSGAGSLRITGPAPATYSDQSVRLQPDTTYTVSYWVKTQNVSGPGISVRYAQLSPTTYILRQSDKVSGTQDWKQMSMTFTTPKNYTDGRFDLQWELSGGQAWVDDVVLSGPDGPVASDPAPVNLAQNGSFDANASGYPIGWRPRSTAAWDGSVKRSGAGSLHISGPAAATYSDQSLKLKPGTTYTASYWVKTQNVSGPGINIRYAQVSPSTYVIRFSDKVSGTQDWKQMSITFTTPTNYVDGRLDLQWELSGGDAWIDDLTLVEGGN